MQPTTLYDYYTSIGQKLPSVQERTSLATSAGISGYTGTAQQNTTLLNYLLKNNTNLPTTTVPTTATNVQNTPSPTTTTTSPTIGTTGNAMASSAGVQSYIDTNQQYMTDLKTELEAQRKVQAENQSFLQKLMKNKKDASTVRQEEFAKIGIDPAQYFADQKAKIAEIDTLNKEFNDTKTAMETEKNMAVDRMASTGYISREQAAIERRYAPTLNRISANVNSKAAVLQALQGNFNEAKSLVNQAVEDATADYKFKFDAVTAFYQMNEQYISRLDTRYQNAIQNSIDMAQKQYENARQDKMEISKLMLDNPTAGIKITDTFDEAMAKYNAAYKSSLSYRESIAKINKTSGGGSTIGSAPVYLDTVMQTAIDAGATPDLAVLKAIEYAEGVGIQLGKDERNSLIERAKLLKPTTITQTTQQQVEEGNKAQLAGMIVGGLSKNYITNSTQQITSPFKTVGSFFEGLFGF